MSRKQVTAPDLVNAAAELACAPRQRHRVLVALVATPRRDLAERLDTWLPKGAVIAWLKERGHDTAGLRVGGGFLYEVSARDPYGAADQARQLLDRMIARPSFLRKSRDGIVPTDHVWVDGHTPPIPVAGPARGADIMSLVHEGHLYQVDGRGRSLRQAGHRPHPVLLPTAQAGRQDHGHRRLRGQDAEPVAVRGQQRRPDLLPRQRPQPTADGDDPSARVEVPSHAAGSSSKLPIPATPCKPNASASDPER
jgi:hypothetical protein